MRLRRHSCAVAGKPRTLRKHMLRQRGELPELYTPDHLGQIIQAACLAHDIGNPPFGHAGEEAIRDWFKDSGHKEQYFKELKPAEWADFTAFDGNAQGFRVINALENNKDRGGFRLTLPVIAALVKYPCSAYEAQGEGGRKVKFNFYTAEKTLFAEIFTAMRRRPRRQFRRRPLRNRPLAPRCRRAVPCFPPRLPRQPARPHPERAQRFLLTSNR